MATNVDIEGLAREWEADENIRLRLRTSGALFVQTVQGKPLEVNIKGAEVHVDILKPLLIKLVAPDLSVGLCSIPDLEREFLDFLIEHIFCFA